MSEPTRERAIHLDRTTLVTGPGGELAELAQLVRDGCAAPIALVSVTGAGGEAIRVCLGVAERRVPRGDALLTRALAAPDGLLVISDTRSDARAGTSPLVTGEPHVRFYAGAAIVAADGAAVGTVCALDVVPRELTPVERETLRLTARAIAAVVDRSRACDALERTECVRDHALERLDLLETALAEANDAVVIAVRDEATSAYSVSYVNETFTRIYGWAPHEIIGENVARLYADDAECRLQLDAARRGERSTREITVARRDGTHVVLEASDAPARVRTGAVEMTYLVSVQRDLAERLRAERTARANAALRDEIAMRRDAERELAHAASHDALTGLPNRATLMRRVEAIVAAVAQGRRAGDRAALLFIDLDRFKQINDTMGHLHGDAVLVEVASRLRGCVREGDLVARFAGDEFVVLVSTEHESATRVGERLADRIGERLRARAVRSGALEVTVTASVGVVAIDAGAASAESVLRDADVTMYHAKARGRDRYKLFRPELRESAIASARLEREIRAGMARGEFTLAYQPIVSLRSGAIEGFESLLRWNSPGAGERSAGAFIDAAERSGLIVPLGAWALVEACRRLRSWQTRPRGARPVVVSVNLSARQLVEPDLVAHVRRTVAETGVDARGLALELTESSLLADVDDAVRTFAELRALGVRVYLDDFGTGYSSLSYLRRLGVDRLKIDRSFVSADGRSELADPEIVGAVVALAHRLGIETVAEGVESERQRRELGTLDCDYAQGWALGPPLPPAAATALLEAEDRAVREA